MPKFIGNTARDDRHEYIADRLCGKADAASVKQLSDELGVCVDTIYRDLKSEEMQVKIKSRIREHAGGIGISQAWRNIIAAVNTGDVKTSKWLIERCGVFEEAGTLDDFQSFLDAINGNGHAEDTGVFSEN